jgi:hypothetical protein
LHHTGVEAIWSRIRLDELPEPQRLALRFLRLVVAEGAAIKFINNAPGARTPTALPGGPRGFDRGMEEDWTAHEAEHDDIFAAADTLLRDVLAGRCDAEGFDEALRCYWLPVPPQSVGRSYYLGAELLGTIHRVLERDAVLGVLRHPHRAVEQYTAAVTAGRGVATAPTFDRQLVQDLAGISPVPPG